MRKRDLPPASPNCRSSIRDESEIARRRAAYEQKLRALSSDIDAGLLEGDLIKALGAKPAVFARLSGRQRPRAAADLRRHGLPRRWRGNFRRRRCRRRPRRGEPIRVGIVSSFFYRHSNWKIPIKGWMSQLDRSRFHVTGYHLGIIHDAADRGRRRPVRPLRASHARHRGLAARNPRRRAARADLSRSADGHILAAARRAAAGAGAVQFMGPSGNQRACRRSTISCRAI